MVFCSHLLMSERGVKPSKASPHPGRENRSTKAPALSWRYCPVRLAVGEDGPLIEVPEQQRAIQRIIELRRQGLSLRGISACIAAEGVKLSHEGVNNVLAVVNDTGDGEPRVISQRLQFIHRNKLCAPCLPAVAPP